MFWTLGVMMWNKDSAVDIKRKSDALKYNFLSQYCTIRPEEIQSDLTWVRSGYTFRLKEEVFDTL